MRVMQYEAIHKRRPQRRHFSPPALMCTFARPIPLVDVHFYGHTSVSLPSASSTYSQYSNLTLKTEPFLFLIQSVLYNLLKLNKQNILKLNKQVKHNKSKLL